MVLAWIFSGVLIFINIAFLIFLAGFIAAFEPKRLNQALGLSGVLLCLPLFVLFFDVLISCVTGWLDVDLPSTFLVGRAALEIISYVIYLIAREDALRLIEEGYLRPDDTKIVRYAADVQMVWIYGMVVVVSVVGTVIRLQ